MDTEGIMDLIECLNCNDQNYIINKNAPVLDGHDLNCIRWQQGYLVVFEERIQQMQCSYYAEPG